MYIYYIRLYIILRYKDIGLIPYIYWSILNRYCLFRLSNGYKTFKRLYTPLCTLKQNYRGHTHHKHNKTGLRGAKHCLFCIGCLKCIPQTHRLTGNKIWSVCSAWKEENISTTSRPNSSRRSLFLHWTWSPWGCRCCDSPAGLLPRRDDRNEWPRPSECYPTCAEMKQAF